MKKIALLFTILCVGALFGMEPERGHYVGMEALPKEIKATIVMYLNEYDNLDDIVNAIKITSLTNCELYKIVDEMYGNQKGFAVLAHLLANKFNTTTEDVAYQFNTPAAKTYISLGQKLIKAVKLNTIDEVAQLILQGADVNFTKTYSTTNISITQQGSRDITESYEESPLFRAIQSGNVEIVKLLLDSGAKVESDDYYVRHKHLIKLEGQDAFYESKGYWPSNDATKKIRQLLEEARKK